ncbi:MAG TPA: nuclear transport factor 2 family protein, partial [Acidimicrobiales bacterium]|nr:nuclear transport factor 2 family protein [Acidimicrobiales bacterium]
ASVRGLYEAYQDRDWARAAALLHPQAVVEMPGTAELLEGRDAIIAFQSDYPEPWGVLTVRRLLADADGAAAEVDVVDPEGRRFALAAFWRGHEGLLHRGVEYWVDVAAGTPPPSRSSSPTTRQARRAWGRSGGPA